MRTTTTRVLSGVCVLQRTRYSENFETFSDLIAHFLALRGKPFNFVLSAHPMPFSHPEGVMTTRTSPEVIETDFAPPTASNSLSRISDDATRALRPRLLNGLLAFAAAIFVGLS